MLDIAVQRRTLLTVSIGAIAGAAGVPSAAEAPQESGLDRDNLSAIRQYYGAWEQREWRPFELVLAEDFTFTSPNNDDHISKSTFKMRCWETQKNYIQRFELSHTMQRSDAAFVMYVCHTTNGKEFQNVEFLRLRNAQITSIECYFGAQSSFASSVSTPHD